MKAKKPNILFYDIETSPNLGYTWGKYDQNVIRFEKEREIMSVAWKWFGDRKTSCLTREGHTSDKTLLSRFYEVINSADIVVAHNGDSFDARMLRVRMLYHKLPPLKRLASVDTLKIARTLFKFNGNGLEDLCRYLGLGSKHRTPGFDMWLGCLKGNSSSWALLERYNKKDVVLLENVYKHMRPWIVSHPSVAKILNPQAIDACPKCGSKNTQRRGVHATQSSVRQQMCCNSCGGWFLTKMPKKTASKVRGVK